MLAFNKPVNLSFSLALVYDIPSEKKKYLFLENFKIKLRVVPVLVGIFISVLRYFLYVFFVLWHEKNKRTKLKNEEITTVTRTITTTTTIAKAE